MARSRISKNEALSFLLTYLVVEKSMVVQLDQLTLFTLTTLAEEASDLINSEDGIIAHEIIEKLAHQFLEKNE